MKITKQHQIAVYILIIILAVVSFGLVFYSQTKSVRVYEVDNGTGALGSGDEINIFSRESQENRINEINKISFDDWANYSNDKYGFRFKYPRKWKNAPDGWRDYLNIRVVDFENTKEQENGLNVGHRKHIELADGTIGEVGVFFYPRLSPAGIKNVGDIYYGLRFYFEKDLFEIYITLHRDMNYELPKDEMALEKFISEIELGQGDKNLRNDLADFASLVSTLEIDL